MEPVVTTVRRPVVAVTVVQVGGLFMFTVTDADIIRGVCGNRDRSGYCCSCSRRSDSGGGGSGVGRCSRLRIREAIIGPVAAAPAVPLVGVHALVIHHAVPE